MQYEMLKAEGNQLQTKMHHVLEDVRSIKESIHSTKTDYNERLINLMEPLQEELHHTKQQLADSKALASSTDEELANVKEDLRNAKQEHAQQETTIQALRESQSHQNVQHDADIQAMITEKKNLSDRNDKQEADIKVLQDTLKEIEETLSRQNDQHQDQVNDIQADNEARIHTLHVERDTLTGQVAELTG